MLLFLLTALFLSASDGLPEGAFEWRKAKPVAPGIRMKHFDLKKPRDLNMFAVRVDLGHPRIYLVNTSRDKDWGKPMPDYPAMKIQTKRRKVAESVKMWCEAGHDVRLAVNATPWGPWRSPYNHKYAGNIGLVISDGVAAALPGKRTVPALVVRKDGSADMIECKVGEKVDEDIVLALSGFQFVLRNGKQACNNSKVLHPRTFYGLSQDRRYLYFLIVDGRQKGFSEGFACFEGARFLAYLGAWDGINMDGGGSTTLVTCRNGKVQIVNTPPGSGKVAPAQKVNATRSVATSLGVCLKNRRSSTVRRE